MAAMVRNPRFAPNGRNVDEFLLLQLTALDSAWGNPSVPVRTRFYRRDGRTGQLDTNPLRLLYFLKGTNTQLNGTYDYLSNEVLRALQVQQGLSNALTIADIDILIEGVSAYSGGTAYPYQVLTIRYDENTTGNDGVADLLIPAFLADPTNYRDAHKPSNGWALGDALLNLHPFKQYIGGNYDFTAMARQLCID